MSPLPTNLTWLRRIIFMISYPAIVFLAVLNRWNHWLFLMSRLINRWDCSTRLLRYLFCRNRHAFGMIPSAFSSSNAGGYALFLSTDITRGVIVCGLFNIFLKKRLAACSLWCTKKDHRKSRIMVGWKDTNT